jgi:ABC-type multidrug transport system fused ATPase/permease subunit
MNNYKILSYIIIKEDRVKVLVLFIGMLFLGFTEMAGVASIVPFMSMVTDNSIIFSNQYLNYIYVSLEFENIDDFLFFSGIVVLCFMSLANFFTIYMNWKIQSFVFMQEYRLALRMLSKYLTQKYVFFLGRNSSDLNKNILTEIGRAMSGVIYPILQVISKSIIVFALLLLLILADPGLAVSIFLSLGLIYFSLFYLVRKMLHKIGNTVADSISKRYKILSEIFSSIKILKLKGGENEFIGNYSGPSKKYAKFSAISTVISHAPRYLLEVVAFGGIMVIVIYLISKGESNSYVISYMALYAFAGYRLLPALQAIYANLTLIYYNFAALEAISVDLKLEEKPIVKPSDVKTLRPILKSNIALSNVNFSYPNTNKELLKNINLKIIKGTSVAFVGETGAGKSTLIDIILGLHIPDKGKLLLNDLPMDEELYSSWRSSIGYVPQDIYLSDDTILNNIAFMRPENQVSYADVIESAKIANIHEFINDLPEKYETKVGERGVRLSGGQKQRIGIARALYNKPEVLVLDEATSAMDTVTEENVMKAIENQKDKKTIIMIAHRITTIQNCDVIYMLDNGVISDSGDYEELSQKNNNFQKMAKNK